MEKRHREWTYGYGERGEEGEMFGKSNMETYITMCKIDSQREFAQGTQIGTLYQPRGVGWGENGREVQKGGDICISMIDSC